MCGPGRPRGIWESKVCRSWRDPGDLRQRLSLQDRLERLPGALSGDPSSISCSPRSKHPKLNAGPPDLRISSVAPVLEREVFCDTCNTGEILIETTAAGGSGAGEGCRSAVCAGTLQSSIKANYRCDTCPRVVNGVSITKGLDNSVCGDRCTGNSEQVTSPLNWLSLKFGRTASVKTEYKCARCSRIREVVELENQVGTHQQVCNVVCAGRLHEIPGSRTFKRLGTSGATQPAFRGRGAGRADVRLRHGRIFVLGT